MLCSWRSHYQCLLKGVPAEDVKRLLEERPEIAGLTVPAMPMGSPGMEGPRPERYRVLAVGRDGKLSVYATHGP